MSISGLLFVMMIAALTIAEDPFSEEFIAYSARPYRIYRSRAPFGFSSRSPQHRENRLEVFIDQDQGASQWSGMLRQPILGFSPWTDFESSRFRRNNN
ncbi:hypothetical protein QR680_004373 [Steinernema hermaphroditum]|uniref:Uncharacterized protein n=1 Tax=Steinernema hermaphroditum TaxID=289476 RepID=A0AA39HPJ3_9BILA|nr:hypothetical protein QR680_004373 [Steinernema hermaphroditum]